VTFLRVFKVVEVRVIRIHHGPFNKSDTRGFTSHSILRLGAPHSSTPQVGLSKPRKIPQEAGVIPFTVSSSELQQTECQNKKTIQSLRNPDIEQIFFPLLMRRSQDTIRESTAHSNAHNIWVKYFSISESRICLGVPTSFNRMALSRSCAGQRISRSSNHQSCGESVRH